MEILSKRLWAVSVLVLTTVLAVIIVYETNILLEGPLSDDYNTEFLVVTLMELVTLAAIPCALRFMKFGVVRKRVFSKGVNGFAEMAIVRHLMILLPLMVNTVCYYLFMNVAFGYMAIILFISFAFITPTKNRFRNEYDSIK